MAHCGITHHVRLAVNSGRASTRRIHARRPSADVCFLCISTASVGQRQAFARSVERCFKGAHELGSSKTFDANQFAHAGHERRSFLSRKIVCTGWGTALIKFGIRTSLSPSANRSLGSAGVLITEKEFRGQRLWAIRGASAHRKTRGDCEC